jgi:hypothetical protein
MMKRSIQLAVAAAFLAAGMAQAATVLYNTNYVQTVTVSLTATVQSTNNHVTMAKLTSADIIKAFGKALNKSFSSQAQLLRVSSQAGYSDFSGSKFVVRDIVNKTNKVDTSVSIGTDTWSEAVFNSTTSKGKTTGTVYDLDELWFGFDSSSPTLTDFDFVGFGTATIQNGALSMPGNGVATIGGNSAITTGTVTLSAQTMERTPISD